MNQRKGLSSVGRRGLEGLNILDFSWVVAGPVTTRLLGAHGATVVRVESMSRVDMCRSQVPMAGGVPGVNRSAVFDAFNNDKLSMALNLNKLRGLEIAKRLCKWADVVIENFTPGRMEKWGLSYRDLKKVNPRIIMVSLSMEGQTGPASKQAGFGTELQSLAGFTNLVRWPDRPPSPLSFAYTDFIVPWYAIVAIVAAIEHRERTGEGQHIDISQYEVGSFFLASVLMDYLCNGRIEQPRGNRCRYAAPHGVYPCKGDDRWCAIGVFDDSQWDSLCKVIGSNSLTREIRFRTLKGRQENETELDALISDWTVTQSAEEVVHRMQSEGVPAGVVADGRDLHSDPQLLHRQHFHTLVHPELGAHSYEMPSWRLSKTPCEIRRPSPCLGEHTEYVCTEILGMADNEFIELLNEGILE